MGKLALALLAALFSVLATAAPREVDRADCTLPALGRVRPASSEISVGFACGRESALVLPR